MKTRKVPMRMCVGCREMKPKKELIRVVHSPEGEVSVDLTGRKPGRGAYLCPREECLAKALKQKQLERAFSAPLGAETQEGLRQAVASLKKEEADGST